MTPTVGLEPDSKTYHILRTKKELLAICSQNNVLTSSNSTAEGARHASAQARHTAKFGGTTSGMHRLDSESIPTIHTTDSCTKSINERPTRIAVRGVGINSKRNDHENYTHMIYVGIENALPMQCSLNAL